MPSPCLKPSPFSSPCLKSMPSPCLKPSPSSSPAHPQAHASSPCQAPASSPCLKPIYFPLFALILIGFQVDFRLLQGFRASGWAAAAATTATQDHGLPGQVPP